MLLTFVIFIASLSILSGGLGGFRNKQALLRGWRVSSILESNKASTWLVSFYSFPCFLGMWPIDNRFAGKLSDSAGIAIRGYLSNKWTSLFVSSKVTAVWAKTHLFSGL